MRRPLVSLLSALALSSTWGVMAQTFESHARITDAAVAQVRGQLPETAEVAPLPLDARLRLPPCEHAPAAEAPSLRGASARVAVRCDQPSWTVHVALRVADIREVAVLQRAGQRQMAISPSDITLQARDVALSPFGYFEDVAALSGQQLRRNLPAGTVLSPNDVEPERLVQRGSPVMMVAGAAGIEVLASGISMADGGLGQTVRVRNERTGRIIEGVVRADGRVDVR